MFLSGGKVIQEKRELSLHHHNSFVHLEENLRQTLEFINPMEDIENEVPLPEDTSQFITDQELVDD